MEQVLSAQLPSSDEVAVSLSTTCTHSGPQGAAQSQDSWVPPTAPGVPGGKLLSFSVKQEGQ